MVRIVEIIDVLKSHYDADYKARGVLIEIGYPTDAAPQFVTAESFWPQLLLTLDDRVVNGTELLLTVTAARFPGGGASELLRERAESAARESAMPSADPAVWPAPVVIEVGPEPVPRRYLQKHVEAEAGQPPPAPPSDLANAHNQPDPDGCPTLTLEGADLPQQFLRVAREILGPDVDLLYVAREQSAVGIPDPGDQDETVRHELQERMSAFAPTCRVTYRRFSFRPYLYRRLVVYGPDTSGYELSSVPSTSTPEDIAVQIVAQTREATSGEQGLVRVVVNHEMTEISRRLDPYTTLHECGVADGDRMRVAPHAIAGSVSPSLYLARAHRAVAQLRAYAAHSRVFAVDSVDDEVLPTRITITIAAQGLAPPEDLDELTGDRDPEDVIPLRVRPHRVTIHLRAMFPLEAPRIVWETPIFHPNVSMVALAGYPTGALLFEPLLHGYHPERDLAYVAGVLTDIAMYREYDLGDGDSAANPVAAWWAGTAVGQTHIRAIGGRSQSEVAKQREGGPRPPRLFWIKPLGEVSHGL
jgi:hypothetical protein